MFAKALIDYPERQDAETDAQFETRCVDHALTKLKDNYIRQRAETVAQAQFDQWIESEAPWAHGPK